MADAALEIHEFSGTHREVGRAHGETLRERVRASLATRMDRCIARTRKKGHGLSPDEIRAIAREHLPHLAGFSTGLHEENGGIAEGAGVRPEEAFFVSGYTDVADVVARRAAGSAGDAGSNAGCTTMWASTRATTGGGAYAAQTWDMFAGAAAELVGLRLRVDEEPECFVFSYGGCVGMMGMNALGVAVCGNSLSPTDARPGVPWTFLCRAVLASASAAEAPGIFNRARLCSGHHFLVADASGEAHGIETTGTRWAEIPVMKNTYAHTNHYLDPELVKLEAPRKATSSSPHRLARARALLAGAAGRIDRAWIEGALGDHENGEDSICAHGKPSSDFGPVRSCGALVMDLARREARAVRGNPCRGEFRTVSLAG